MKISCAISRHYIENVDKEKKLKKFLDFRFLCWIFSDKRVIFPITFYWKCKKKKKSNQDDWFKIINNLGFTLKEKVLQA